VPGLELFVASRLTCLSGVLAAIQEDSP